MTAENDMQISLVIYCDNRSGVIIHTAIQRDRRIPFICSAFVGSYPVQVAFATYVLPYDVSPPVAADDFVSVSARRSLAAYM